jgi:hypothetical protein
MKLESMIQKVIELMCTNKIIKYFKGYIKIFYAVKLIF